MPIDFQEDATIDFVPDEGLAPPAQQPFSGATPGSPFQPLTAPYSEYQQRGPGVSPLTGEKIYSSAGPSLNPLEPILSDVLPRYSPLPPQLVGPPSKAESIAGGTYNALAGASESVTSPAVLLSGGLAEAVPVLTRPVAATWAAIMAKDVPKQVEQTAKVFREDRPLNEKVEAAESLALSLGFITIAGKHALTPERIAPLTSAEIGKAQEQARVAGLPSQEPIEFPLSQIEEARGRRLLETGMVTPPTPRQAPIVPETPAVPKISVIEEIRRANARTARDIQRLFPDANLSKEQAKVYRNAAWGEPKEVMPAEEVAQRFGPKAPEPPPVVPEPPPAPETAPAAPQPSAAGVPAKVEPWQMTREEFAKQAEPDYPTTYKIELEAVAGGEKPAHYGFYPANAPWAPEVIGIAKRLGLHIKRGPRKTDYIITPNTESGRARADTIYTQAKAAVVDEGLLDDVTWHDRFAKLLGYGPEFEGRIQAISGPTALENKRLHRHFVWLAIREGKPVPPEVMAEYPDLAPKPTPPIPEQPVKAGEAIPEAQVTPQSPSAPFSPKQAKAQKAFLLEEIDKAHEAAPEGEVETPATPPSYELEEAKTKRLAENKGVYARNAAKFGTITIRVPGDGVFTVINERGAIERFKEMAKQFPTTAPKPSTPKTASVKPTQAAPITKVVERPDVLKAADLFSGTDENRIGLYKVFWSDGERTVSTDGRRMLIVNEGVGGTPKSPKLFDASGKEVIQPESSNQSAKFPENWQQVIPQDKPKYEITVDTEQLHNVVRQAELMTSAAAPSVRIAVNPDNTIGVSSLNAEGEGFAHNVHANPKQVVFMSPEYVRDALNAARRLGDEKVKLAIIDELSPVQFIGSNHRSIIMPMRGAGGTPIETVSPKAPSVPEKPATVSPQPASAPEPAISFPGIGSLREKQATAMELGKIRKAEPELWKAITQMFGVGDSPSKVAKAAQANFKRQREAQSRAASAGPGAASPVEFEQRARAAGDAAASGQKPPGDNPPIATDANQGPSIDITRANRDYNILNRFNSGQFAFWFGKLGQAAKAAWERMALGEFRMRESIRRDVTTYVDGLLKSLPREFRRDGGKAFFEILDGKTLEQITDEWSMRDGGTEVIKAATELKGRLEQIRTTIRDTRREAYNAYLNGLDRPMLEDLFRKNIDDKLDISAYSKESLAEALTKDAYRDDWGIADGSYLPHLFFGNWKVTATDASGNTRFVTRSRTPQEAKAEIYKFTTRNPDLKNATFHVEQDTVVPADMIRLGDKRFWHLVGKMKEATGLSEAEVKQAQQGIIGKKSSKQKWWGNLQKREGYQGYSQDYRQAMSAYLNGFHRWVELSQMQREVQPLIEQVRREGRPNAANRLEELMENLWGKPAQTTLQFDALVRQIPGLRDFIKPLALDRWSRNIRTLVAMLTLKTARFATVNRLQPLQGLYPLVGERILAQAKLMQHTAEGRALLDEAGVRLDPGQYRAERAGAGKLTELSERFSGERSNQELAFLAMYRHGIEQGMAKPEAMKYAKLRGQLFTQFTPLVVDVPQVMQGPLSGLLFQFKRFPIKQAELLTRLIQEKRIGGIARWLGVMAIAGGASYFLRQFYTDAEKKKRLRDRLAEQTGETVADGIMYGMPGLIGADLSGSLVIGDEPFGQNIYEKVGRSVVGPAAGIAVETAGALGREKREPTTLRQDATTLLRRFPTLRPLGELLAWDDFDVRTPDGEVAYRKKLKDAIVGIGSFRSANESNIRLAVDAMFELKQEMSQLKNAYFVASEGGNVDKAQDAIDKFNDRWPELEITASDLSKYVNYRKKGLDKTDVERISGKKLAPLAP